MNLKELFQPFRDLLHLFLAQVWILMNLVPQISKQPRPLRCAHPCLVGPESDKTRSMKFGTPSQ